MSEQGALTAAKPEEKRQRSASDLVAEALDLAEAGADADAFRLFIEAVTLDPLHPEAVHGLGRFLLSRERFAEAIECLRRAVRVRPQDAEAHADLGAALAASGEFEEALAVFEAAANLDADNEVAREGLAIVRGVLAQQRSQPSATGDAASAETAPAEGASAGARAANAPTLPAALNLGQAAGFREDHLNLDVDAASSPDAVVDLGAVIIAGDGLAVETARFGTVRLVPDAFEQIVAHEVLGQVADLAAFMGNCLQLLKFGGIMEIAVPYDLSLRAWENPACKRAFNENSFAAFTEGSARLGWKQARFELAEVRFAPSPYGRKLEEDGVAAEEILRSPRAIEAMLVRLRKVPVVEGEAAPPRAVSGAGQPIAAASSPRAALAAAREAGFATLAPTPKQAAAATGPRRPGGGADAPRPTTAATQRAEPAAAPAAASPLTPRAAEPAPPPRAAEPAPAPRAAEPPVDPSRRVFAGGWAEHRDRHCVWIVSPDGYAHHHAFDEVATALSEAFAELGGSAPLVRDPAEWNGRAPIVFGANLLSAAAAASLPAGSIIVNLEQVEKGSSWFNEAYLGLLKRFPVLDYSARNRAALVAAGVPRVELLEIGYVPGLARIAARPEAERDIDVLFYGSLNERRQKVLAGLAARGLKVKHVFGAYGAERDAAIARAKVVLNLHYYETAIFEVVRVSYLLANGVAVVTEGDPADPDISPFAGGLAVVPYGKLVETCATLAGDAYNRSRMARAGFEKMAARPQADLLRRLMPSDEAATAGAGASPSGAAASPAGPRHPFAGGWEAHRDRHCIWIVSPPGLVDTQAFDEVAATLSSAFAELGGSAPVVRSPSEWGGRAPIVLGANLLADVALPLPRDSIIVNLEQMVNGSRWLNETYLSFLRRFPLLDYSAHNRPVLAGLGIGHGVPFAIGYTPGLTRIAQRPEAEKDIDVLFYGWPNARRERVLAELRQRGLNVVHLFKVFGEKRDEAIARAKVVLNVHFYASGIFEIVRVSYLMANRACIVSEGRPDDPDAAPFVGGLELAGYEALSERCVRLLGDAARREAVAGRGFEIFTGRPQASLLRALMDAGAAQA